MAVNSKAKPKPKAKVGVRAKVTAKSGAVKKAKPAGEIDPHAKGEGKKFEKEC